MSRGLADLAKLDATAQMLALANRRISASDLLEASLVQAEAMSDLNAVIRRDVATARARARIIDDRRARGDADGWGPLAGLPMTIKDSFDVEGMPASSGLKALLNRTPDDASAVAKIRAAGAVIWGKTNVPVMAGDAQTFNKLYGTTNNPWDVRRTPGGSSGGAAVAVATGITAAEIGSDLSGSLRGPASFCGVFAHKPTFGLVSTRGHIPPAPGAMAEVDMNVVGPMARSARDLRLLLSVMTRSPLAARAPAASLPGLKVALWLDEPAFALDPQVRIAVESLAGKLSAEGAHVEAVEHMIEGAALLDAFVVLLFAATGRPAPWLRGPAGLARLLGAGRMSWAGVVRASSATHVEWLRADEARVRLSQSMNIVFSRYDVVLAPAMPVAAFPHDHGAMSLRRVGIGGRKLPYGALIDWAALAAACGLPATVVPAGRTRDGLPVGVQIIGPRGGDSKTLAVAQAIDEQIGGYAPPPML